MKSCYTFLKFNIKIISAWYLPGGPVTENLPSNAGDTSLITDQGNKIQQDPQRGKKKTKPQNDTELFLSPHLSCASFLPTTLSCSQATTNLFSVPIILSRMLYK